MYRFLLRPKWLLFLAGCAAFSALFVSLGFWQLDRLDQRRAMNQRVIDGRRAAPVEVTRIFGVDRAPAADQEFRQVKAEGTYDTAHEYLVHGRTMNDRAGVFVLTPLVLADGSRVLVLRGWVASSNKGADVAPDFPAAATGTVTVVGRARQPEDAAGGTGRIGSYPTVRRIAPAQLARAMHAEVLRGYVELVRQEPAAAPGLAMIPEPELTEGPHLSYAVQWFLFAAMTFVGYGIYARREEQARREPAAEPLISTAQ